MHARTSGGGGVEMSWLSEDAQLEKGTLVPVQSISSKSGVGRGLVVTGQWVIEQ